MFSKNSCSRIESLLWGYSARTLTAEERETVEAHLTQCAECKATLAEYVAITGAVANLRETTLPASQTNWLELRERIAAFPEPISSAKPRFSVARLTLFGATLAGACAVFLVLRSQSPPDAPSVKVEVAGLPAQLSPVRSGERSPVKSPEKAPAKTAPKSKPKSDEGIRVYSAFDRREVKSSRHKKSEPMIARSKPLQSDFARVDGNSEHSLKFGLDAEVPVERTERRFVMGSVPANDGYSVVPASYEEKEMKAW